MSYQVIFLLLIWFVSYAQLVGVMQMDYTLEPAYMSAQPCAFDVLWPAVGTAIPVVGQIIAFSWAFGLFVAHHQWPKPRLTIDYDKIHTDKGLYR